LKISPSKIIATTSQNIDYGRLFHDLPEPYLLFEASEPYRIVDTNRAREEITGVTKEECVGKPLFSVYPYTNERFNTTVAKDLHERLQRLVRTGHSERLEPIGQSRADTRGINDTIYLQATYFPLHGADGTVQYILASTREVTDELHAIERVAAAESRLSVALTIGKVGSWIFDAASGRIIGDENLKQLFKMTDEHARTYTLEAFLNSVHEDDRPRVVAAVQASLTNQVPFEEECRITITDGSQRWILARGEPEEHGEELVFSGVVVDLTEQRDLRAQVELARQQDRLNRQAARILQKRNEELEAISRSKDEFVALASHQLRTPATAVKQYLGMVLEGYVGDITEDQTDVLAKAFGSNERQIQIINQILSAARADTGRLVMAPVPVDLCSLVHGIMADMESSLRQHEHTVLVQLPARPVQISADIGYLRMAIENVLHNAIVYTPKGGQITVKLRRNADNCLLSISDTGVGIRKGDIGKLFVKFSRIHNPLSVEAGGSGIGLYLTAEIVRLHNGDISVSSRLRKGTTFAISLPVMHNEKSSISRKLQE